jgi:hypothetical protein
MLAPLRERFDAILSHPSDATNLDFSQPRGKASELWSWCDSLFMAPPAWARLTTATGDEKYLNFAVTNWWRTTDYLYDTNEHLFFRDSTYFNKREANGAKVFWSRGNGWVMGGLVRVLQFLPMNSPDRPLDPDSYPLKETSGSGFYAYALAWGVNQGLLDRAQFEPAVRKAWTALVACVDADGKLTHVQPIGADPKKFTDDSTEVYGTGAFLLAGSEVYRMAAFAHIEERLNVKQVKVTNPSSFRRECETVEIDHNPFMIPDVIGNINRFFPDVSVMDGTSSRILDSQTYYLETNQPPDRLLFQVDLAPGETKTFYILRHDALAAVPPPIVKTSAPENPSRRFPAPRDPPLQVTIGN